MKLTILSFLILFFLSNTAVSEDITYTEGDFSYYMTNEGAVLVDWENSGEKLPLSTLIVPNTLGGKPVIGIGSGTFASSQSEPITDPLEIVIPKGCFPRRRRIHGLLRGEHHLLTIHSGNNFRRKYVSCQSGDYIPSRQSVLCHEQGLPR